MSSQQQQQQQQPTNSQLQPSSSRRRLPSFNFTPDDESIEELLKTLGYSPGQSRANSLSSRNEPPVPNQNTQQRDNESRGSMLMLDIDGREFSIHEHSLSPVSSVLLPSLPLSINTHTTITTSYLVPFKSKFPVKFTENSIIQ
jgi:hypothetical protein